jgi:hypothetical protein
MRMILTLALAVSMAAGSRGFAQPADIVLAIPGHSNMTPWIAASGSLVVVVWGASAAGKGDVMVVVSRDGGRTFGTPVRVNDIAGEARISGEIAPRVALSTRGGSGEPVITVAWNARGEATAIKVAESIDGGRTFGASKLLQSPGAAGDRGWQALTVDNSGRAHAIWLDHRGMAAAKSGGEHKGEHDGVAMAQRSGLYYAASGARPRERELFAGVCYCCKTALASGPRGEIVAAWRHVFAGNFRDIAFTVSRDGGKSFAPLARINEDGWSINGCPDDGPAAAIDATGKVHVAWPTVLGGEEGAIFYASSADARTFATPTRVPTLGGPKPSHPFITIDAKGRPVIAWDEVQNGVRRVALRRVARAETAIAFDDARVLGEGSYPVMAAASAGLVVAWTQGPPASATVRVRVIQ